MVLHPILLVVGLLLAGDITLSRLHYQYMVHQTVTTPKREMVHLLHNLTANDTQLCALGEKLSNARHAALESARTWHPIGKYGAELFDHLRGSTLKSKKAGLAKKTCRGLIESVDKTNYEMNIMAAGSGLLAILCLGLLLRRRSEQRRSSIWRDDWKHKIETARPGEPVFYPADSSSSSSKAPKSAFQSAPPASSFTSSFADLYPPYDPAKPYEPEREHTEPPASSGPVSAFADLYPPFNPSKTYQPEPEQHYVPPPASAISKNKNLSTSYNYTQPENYQSHFSDPAHLAEEIVLVPKKRTEQSPSSASFRSPSSASYHSQSYLAEPGHLVEQIVLVPTKGAQSAFQQTTFSAQLVAPQSTSNFSFASDEYEPFMARDEHVEAPPPRKRRNSVSKDAASSEVDLPKTPRRKSKGSLKVDPEPAEDWSPLTVESLQKNTAKPSQMIGGIDVSTVVNTPRRRSANTVLGPASSAKKPKSNA